LYEGLFLGGAIGFLGFAMWMVGKGLSHPETFTLSPELLEKPIRREVLTSADKTAYANRIVAFMEMHQPFLDPLLTLHQLAKGLGMSPYYLSLVINECLSQNFYDFINGYRIKLSLEMLNDPKFKQKTILNILYACGFNSKSTFNAAFKKHTGVTPSVVRKKVQASQIKG
jgi:AraC-like DNA-binding protein